MFCELALTGVAVLKLDMGSKLGWAGYTHMGICPRQPAFQKWV